MGFTERASCRPYKNCYKKLGGAKTMKSKRRSTKKTPKSKINTNNNSVPSFIYHSEVMTYTSHPEKHTPYGKRIVVNITDEQGQKRLETLNKNGKSIKINTKKLNKNEVNELKRINYIPGLLISV